MSEQNEKQTPKASSKSRPATPSQAQPQTKPQTKQQTPAEVQDAALKQSQQDMQDLKVPAVQSSPT